MYLLRYTKKGGNTIIIIDYEGWVQYCTRGATLLILIPAITGLPGAVLFLVTQFLPAALLMSIRINRFYVPVIVPYPPILYQEAFVRYKHTRAK